jgi:hypothetical protein
MRSKFGHHLAIELNKPQYMWLTKPATSVEPHEVELDRNEIRLLLAAASDRNGQIMTGTTMNGFFVQTSDENFVEDSPRSAAMWKRVLEKLERIGFLNQVNESIYEVTDEGFARADAESAALPVELSVSVTGPPDEQKLSVRSSKPVTLKQIEFLMSSGARISNTALDEKIKTSAEIPLDYKQIIELFNSPRSDRNQYDHSGPAALKLSINSSGQQFQALLPVLLQPKMVNNTNWITVVGSNDFSLK